MKINQTYRGSPLRIVIGIILLATISLSGGGIALTISSNGDTINGSIAYGPATWNSTNFPALVVEETLNVEEIIDRWIPNNKLTYYTFGQEKKLNVIEAKYASYSDAEADGLNGFGFNTMAKNAGNYTMIGWMTEKYVAIMAKPYKHARLIIEQDANDTKSLAVNETWDMGEGWELTLNSIDTGAALAQAWISLSREGIKKDDKVISFGTQDAKPIYTYVENNLAGETYVPVLVTYADNITSNGVQFKHTWLISSNVTEIKVGDIVGSMSITSTYPLTMKNTDYSIMLENGSTINLMDDIYFIVNDSENLSYYPMWTILQPPINQPPVADFINYPMFPEVNQEITFDASSSYDPDGYITSYLWNINGNSFSTRTVNISFPTFGYFSIYLNVTDNNGGESGTSRWIYVSEPPPIPPENDDFDDATVITSLPFVDSVDTFNATTAYDDPYSWCAYWYGHTVWYAYTPTEYSRIEINPSGSDYGLILLSAYQGSPGSLYQVACDVIYAEPNYISGSLKLYTYPNQTVYLMVGSYNGNPGGNLKLKVDILPPLSINMSIDPDGTVNRLTGDAIVHGTMTCSRPAYGTIFVNLSQRAGRFNVFRGSSSFQLWCENSTAWKATVRSSDGPYNAGKVYVEALASANEWLTGDYAVDDASDVVQLKGNER